MALQRDPLVTYSATSTGVTNAVQFNEPANNVTVSFVHASTKTISYIIQGGIDGVWETWIGATTSTGTGIIHSTDSGTAPRVYDRARIAVTASETTGNVTTKFSIIGR